MRTNKRMGELCNGIGPRRVEGFDTEAGLLQAVEWNRRRRSLLHYFYWPRRF